MTIPLLPSLFELEGATEPVGAIDDDPEVGVWVGAQVSGEDIAPVDVNVAPLSDTW